MYLKILHVEDKMDWRARVANILTKNGHQVSSLSNLGEAKRVYASEAFNIVICDADIQNWGDGLIWATELHARGQSVIVIADNLIVPPIPFIHKAAFDKDMLLQLIEN